MGFFSFVQSGDLRELHHESSHMVVSTQLEVYLDSSLRVLFVISVQERFK